MLRVVQPDACSQIPSWASLLLNVSKIVDISEAAPDVPNCNERRLCHLIERFCCRETMCMLRLIGHQPGMHIFTFPYTPFVKVTVSAISTVVSDVWDVFHAGTLRSRCMTSYQTCVSI